ncbi:MAG TPA: DUF4097 family beta strand repeat-containing protein [Thermoanaerobaculia bacterium]|nr:DUF4097 family beta strand repeat-containing protein [Thermoanaerobaculia bacterium]
MRPSIRTSILAAALALVAAGAALAAPQTRQIHETFAWSPGQTLRLANLAGRVDLEPVHGGPLVVDGTIHAEGADAAETQKLLAGMIFVKSRDGKGRDEMALAYPVEKYHAFHFPRPERDSDIPSWLSFFAESSSSTTYRGQKVRIYSRKRSGAPTLYADLRISVPVGSDVAIRNAIGAIRGGDLEGALSVDTGSGDVRLASFAGRLSVDTGSGDVKLDSARGETTIKTGSGNIVVGHLVGNGVVETGSGDVVLDQVAAGKLKLDTGSGNVTVKEGAVMTLVADTGSGDVRLTGLDMEELTADTGSGNVTLESSLAKAKKVVIETGSGDVRIAAGDAASFDLDSDQGSGDLRVEYADAVLRRNRHKVVGAKRGDGKTHIHVETGSGDCTIKPQQ